MSLKPKKLFLGVREFWVRCPDTTHSELLQNSLRVREQLRGKGVQQLPWLGAGIAVGQRGLMSFGEAQGMRTQHRSCRIKAEPSGQDQ